MRYSVPIFFSHINGSGLVEQIIDGLQLGYDDRTVVGFQQRSVDGETVRLV